MLLTGKLKSKHPAGVGVGDRGPSLNTSVTEIEQTTAKSANNVQNESESQDFFSGNTPSFSIHQYFDTPFNCNKPNTGLGYYFSRK